MSSDKPDKNHLKIVINRNNKAICIAFNIENNPAIANNTGIFILLLKFIGILPCRTFCIMVP